MSNMGTGEGAMGKLLYDGQKPDGVCQEQGGTAPHTRSSRRLNRARSGSNMMMVEIGTPNNRDLHDAFHKRRSILDSLPSKTVLFRSKLQYFPNPERPALIRIYIACTWVGVYSPLLLTTERATET